VRSTLLKNDLLARPAFDTLPCGKRVERWCGFIDARGMEVGAKPNIEARLLKKYKSFGKLQSTVCGLRPAFSCFGQSKDSFLPILTNAGKEDSSVVSVVQKQFDFIDFMNHLNSSHLEDALGGAYICAPTVVDGGAYLSNCGHGINQNWCPFCGASKRHYARPNPTAPDRPDRTTLMGLPVLTWEDHPKALLKPRPPRIPGYRVIPEIFMLVWGGFHAFSHLIAEHVDGVHHILTVLSPHDDTLYAGQMKQKLPKWYTRKEWESCHNGYYYIIYNNTIGGLRVSGGTKGMAPSPAGATTTAGAIHILQYPQPHRICIAPAVQG